MSLITSPSLTLTLLGQAFEQQSWGAEISCIFPQQLPLSPFGTISTAAGSADGRLTDSQTSFGQLKSACQAVIPGRLMTLHQILRYNGVSERSSRTSKAGGDALTCLIKHHNVLLMADLCNRLQPISECLATACCYGLQKCFSYAESCSIMVESTDVSASFLSMARCQTNVCRRCHLYSFLDRASLKELCPTASRHLLRTCPTTSYHVRASKLVED